MARDFWLKRFSHRRLRRSVSFTAVYANPRDSTLVVETFWRRCPGARWQLRTQSASVQWHEFAALCCDQSRHVAAHFDQWPALLLRDQCFRQSKTRRPCRVRCVLVAKSWPPFAPQCLPGARTRRTQRWL